MKFITPVIAILVISFLALGSTDPPPTVESSTPLTEVDVGAIQQEALNGTEKEGDQKIRSHDKTTWYWNIQMVVLIWIILVMAVVFLVNISDMLFWKPGGCSCTLCKDIKPSHVPVSESDVQATKIERLPMLETAV